MGRQRWRSGPGVVLLAVGVIVVALVVAASTTVIGDDAAPASALSSAPTQVVYRDPDVPAAVLTSRELLARAPTVVLAPTSNPAVLPDAAATARRLHVPVFTFDATTVDAVRAELTRLGTSSVILPAGTSDSLGLPVVAESGAQQAVPRAGESNVVVLVADDSADALATADAAGAVGVEAPSGDPLQSGSAIEALKANPSAPVIGIGGEFGTASLLSGRIAQARTAPELPGGGLTVFPGRRLVALYGSPDSPALGPLGRQNVTASIERAKRLAAQYDSVSDAKVVPAFEIIVTVASAAPGADNNYTSIIDPAVIRPWVEAAGKAGVYVTLDLQPGRMDFLRQAKMYEDLLKLPHVGLALDSEWRLKPNQVHLAQIGSVEAAEVNRTSAWLAALVRDNKLPQKVLVLHEFDSDMLANRKAIDTSHPELAMVIHADGHGTPPVKMGTWRRLVTDLPPNIWMGWKNFYTEDHPMFTPAQTMRVAPAPWFVSYQ